MYRKSNAMRRRTIRNTKAIIRYKRSWKASPFPINLGPNWWTFFCQSLSMLIFCQMANSGNTLEFSANANCGILKMRSQAKYSINQHETNFSFRATSWSFWGGAFNLPGFNTWGEKKISNSTNESLSSLNTSNKSICLEVVLIPFEKQFCQISFT